MPRVKRGTKRRAKRKKILDRASGYFLTKSKLYRSAKEAVDRGLKFAYSGRKQKKRQYRSLWIVRIGIAAAMPQRDSLILSVILTCCHSQLCLCERSKIIRKANDLAESRNLLFAG